MRLGWYRSLLLFEARVVMYDAQVVPYEAQVVPYVGCFADAIGGVSGQVVRSWHRQVR